MLRVNWSAAGKKAIAGKNYFGFSPTFLLGEDGQVGGLPESGEVGSLTNNPAFVGLDRIAGSHFSRLSARDIVIGALALQGFELQK
jgi:phage I-like protein